MTLLETIWQGKRVFVSTTVSRNQRHHTYLNRHMYRRGRVLRQTKNGMLLVKFFDSKNPIGVPPSCLEIETRAF